MPFLVVDSRNSASFSTTNNVNITNQSITAATPYLASGTNGQYRLKVSILTAAGGFKIIDGNGMQVAEKPLVPTISVSNSTAKVTVTGGNPGRVFVMQKSTDLMNWSSVAGPNTVGTNGWSFTFQDTTSNRFGFYRTATTNAVPQ
jgi:hypothetical protein